MSQILYELEDILDIKLLCFFDGVVYMASFWHWIFDAVFNQFICMLYFEKANALSGKSLYLI